MLIKVSIVLIGVIAMMYAGAYFVNSFQLARTRETQETRLACVAGRAKNNVACSALARNASNKGSSIFCIGCAQRRMPLHIRQIEVLPYSIYLYLHLQLISSRGINYPVRRGIRLPRGYI